MTSITAPAATATTPDGGCTCAAGAADRSIPDGAAEVPLLADVLAAARQVDRTVARLLDGLMELDEHQLAEVLTGLPLEQWLAIVGRRTRSDRRMLLTACEVLRRLPSLRQAFLVDGTVSWAQTRTMVLQVHRLPRRFDDAIDASVAATIRACAQDDPDTLASAVSRALRSLDDTPEASPAMSPPPVEDFLAIQPRLDGSGGQLFGELGPVGLAIVDAALTPSPDQLRDRAGVARGATARGRARRLVELCDGALAGGDDGVAAATPATGSRPQLVLRVELGTLLDRGQLAGELLTRLTGGKLWVDAQTARDLVAARGADLRTVILDDTGAVVGVGRRTRVPPDWLRDATLALHDTCTAPGCLRPARSSDVDHARPWHPTARGRPGGRTDIDQLAPLCRTHNRTKESAGWQVEQQPDGTRRWHHPGLGLTARSRPATWRPPDVPRPTAHDPPDLVSEARASYDVHGPGRDPPRPAHRSRGFSRQPNQPMVHVWRKRTSRT